MHANKQIQVLIWSLPRFTYSSLSNPVQCRRRLFDLITLLLSQCFWTMDFALYGPSWCLIKMKYCLNADFTSVWLCGVHIFGRCCARICDVPPWWNRQLLSSINSFIKCPFRGVKTGDDVRSTISAFCNLPWTLIPSSCIVGFCSRFCSTLSCLFSVK